MSYAQFSYSYPASSQILVSGGAESPPQGGGAYDSRLLSARLAASSFGLYAAPYAADFCYATPAIPYDLKESRGSWMPQSSAGSCYTAYDPITAAYPDRYGSMDSVARRKNATRETTNTLKAWLYEHRKNPYPTKGEKIMLAIITKMTLTQVSTWFANARRRLKKENKMTWEPRNKPGENEDSSSPLRDTPKSEDSSSHATEYLKPEQGKSSEFFEESTSEQKPLLYPPDCYRIRKDSDSRSPSNPLTCFSKDQLYGNNNMHSKNTLYINPVSKDTLYGDASSTNSFYNSQTMPKDSLYCNTRSKDVLYNSSESKDVLYNGSVPKDVLFNSPTSKDMLYGNNPAIKDVAYSSPMSKDSLYGNSRSKDVLYNSSSESKDVMFNSPTPKDVVYTTTNKDAYNGDHNNSIALKNALYSSNLPPKDAFYNAPLSKNTVYNSSLTSSDVLYNGPATKDTALFCPPPFSRPKIWSLALTATSSDSPPSQPQDVCCTTGPPQQCSRTTTFEVAKCEGECSDRGSCMMDKAPFEDYNTGYKGQGDYYDRTIHTKEMDLPSGGDH